MCTTLIARDTVLAGIFLVQQFQTHGDTLSICIISIAAVDDTTQTFFLVYASVTFIYISREQMRIAGTALFSPCLD